MTITLYDYWRSSASYRVRIALNLLELAHETVPVNLLEGEQGKPENLARNPQGLVPTLEIDGLRLTQSLAIIDYLNDTRGGLLPADPAGRARVRALSHVIAMEIAPVCNLSVRTRVAALSGGAMTADDWQRSFISKGFDAFEALLDHPATGLFCHGDSLTMADLCLVPQVYNARRVGCDVTSWPRLAAIAARLEAIPAVAAALPEKVKP
jgi:maleylacetoacetate isomerase